MSSDELPTCCQAVTPCLCRICSLERAVGTVKAALASDWMTAAYQRQIRGELHAAIRKKKGQP